MTEDDISTLRRLVLILEAGQAANGIDHARQEIYAEALRALLASEASAAVADTAGEKPVCENCNGTGSHGGRFHTDGKGASEYEPYKCDVCDGFGMVPSTAIDAEAGGVNPGEDYTKGYAAGKAFAQRHAIDTAGAFDGDSEVYQCKAGRRSTVWRDIDKEQFDSLPEKLRRVLYAK